MADATKPMKSSSDRRTFLKIGAGVVAGAAIESVVEIPYYSSVIGGNNNSSSNSNDNEFRIVGNTAYYLLDSIQIVMAD